MDDDQRFDEPVVIDYVDTDSPAGSRQRALTVHGPTQVSYQPGEPGYDITQPYALRVMGNLQVGDEHSPYTVKAANFEIGEFKPAAMTISETLTVNGEADIEGGVTIGAHGHNDRLHTRHIDGKDWQSDNPDALHLNWDSGKAVHVGGGNSADFFVDGATTVDGHVQADSATVNGHLQADNATVNGHLQAGSATVNGDLRASGSVDSIIAVESMIVDVFNSGGAAGSKEVFHGGLPWGRWVANPPPVVCTMLSGFNTYCPDGSWNYGTLDNVVTNCSTVWTGLLVPPSVDEYGRLHFTVEAFCQEPHSNQRVDNAVKVTVLIIGRKQLA